LEENGEDDVEEGGEAEADQGETTAEKGYRVEANDEWVGEDLALIIC